MRIRFLQSAASATWNHDCGDVIEAEPRDARLWIKGMRPSWLGDEVPLGRALER
jgi:hypothetical protein